MHVPLTNTGTLSLPKLIAVTGQEGSGKDSVGDYLALHGYMHVSAGDVLRKHARARGHKDPISREVLSEVGDELKKEFGPSPITESTLAEYDRVQKEFPAGLVITGLRRTGELEAFKAHGAVVLWIEAEDSRRFKNQTKRGRADQQNRKDFVKKSREEYFGNTQGGEHGVNLQAVELLADCRVANDSGLEDLYHTAVAKLRTKVK